jgi:hypothetical protein
MKKVTVETVKDELEQKDYNEEENKSDYVKNTARLLSGECKVNIEPFGELVIIKPNYKIHADTEVFRAELMYKVMIDRPHLPTDKELRKMLDKKNIWTYENETEIDRLREDRGSLEEEYKDLISPIKGKNAHKSKKAKNLAQKIADLRNKQNELLIVRNKYLGNSIEAVTENLSRMYLLYKCIKKPDESLAWDTFDIMMEEVNQDVMVKLLTHAALHWAGLREDFLDSVPENSLGELGG